MLSRSEDAALLLGRLLVAALFLPSGYNKLTAFSSVASSLAAKGLPYPEIMAGLLVGAEFLGPLALIIGLWPRWTALALIGFTAATLWMAYGSSVPGLLFRPQTEFGVIPEPRHHWRTVVYFGSGPGAWSRTSLR